jgi:GNAT superfamily N-acetyltransferase
MKIDRNAAVARLAEGIRQAVTTGPELAYLGGPKPVTAEVVESLRPELEPLFRDLQISPAHVDAMVDIVAGELNSTVDPAAHRALASMSARFTLGDARTNEVTARPGAPIAVTVSRDPRYGAAGAELLKRAFPLGDIRPPVDGAGFVAVSNGQVVGALQEHRRQTGAVSGYVHIDYVAAEPTGHGIGNALLKHAIDSAFEQSPHTYRVSLTVREDNPEARMLYESLGFVPAGTYVYSPREGGGPESGLHGIGDNMWLSRETWEQQRASAAPPAAH